MDNTHNYITATYQDGVLKPRGKVDLHENQIVTLKIIPSEKAVMDSKGIVKGKPEYITEIAESGDLVEWNP